MIKVLAGLEPRREDANCILFLELEPFLEILFFMKGSIEIGFEINRKNHFILRKKNKIIIGDNGCTFH